MWHGWIWQSLRILDFGSPFGVSYITCPLFSACTRNEELNSHPGSLRSSFNYILSFEAQEGILIDRSGKQRQAEASKPI